MKKSGTIQSLSFALIILTSVTLGANAQGEPATTTIPATIEWEVDGPDEPATAATHLAIHDSTLLVAIMNNRILEYNLSGEYQSTLIDLDEYGQGIHSLILHGDSIIVHATNPGYDIFLAKYDLTGNELYYFDVTQGQSGSGELILDDGDLTLAWASNCCGTGQTWDTELKKFIGQTSTVEWNTDLCFECNNWAGNCHHGSDYPYDLELHDEKYFVLKHLVTSPCYDQIGLTRVSQSGMVEFDTIYPGQGKAQKLLSTSAGLLMTGHHGPNNNREPFIALLDSDGNLIWERIIDGITDGPAVDVIQLNSGNFLFSYVSEGAFHFLRLNATNELLSSYVLEPNHTVQTTSNEMSPLQDKLVELENGQFLLAYSWNGWFDPSRFSLVKFNLEPLIEGCTNPAACNFNPNAQADDGTCTMAGCTDPNSCNYEPTAGCDDDSCLPSDAPVGCTDPNACNFSPAALCPDSSCVYPVIPGQDCNYGEILCTGGSHWDPEIQMCVTTNICGQGTWWDEGLGQCVVNTICPGDYSGDGQIGAADLLIFLTWFGLVCDEPDVELNACDNLTQIDYQGYNYEIVAIGSQCWFAENLRSDAYTNGDAIPGDLTDAEWLGTASGAQAVYGHDAVNLIAYGRLYNWYAADDSRGLCPSGWHVPTDAEFMTLEMELGMSSSESNSTGWRGTGQGEQMKASDSDSPSWDGTNSSGYSALPGGYRNVEGLFHDVGNRATYWSSSPFSSHAWYRALYIGDDDVIRYSNNRHNGFSVRCVQDE